MLTVKERHALDPRAIAHRHILAWLRRVRSRRLLLGNGLLLRKNRARRHGRRPHGVLPLRLRVHRIAAVRTAPSPTSQSAGVAASAHRIVLWHTGAVPRPVLRALAHHGFTRVAHG